ncbi:beta-ketoacyl-ACP synthase III [Desulfosporosinus sp. OT]|uniref:beta-ketoacyl-ACP synthase III n=1 Tax=Desulfosporosinus sp. OT TaxID=913865 RepID=UPI000223A24B|nr:beta-ketoacyl-ACP synthase III [Desulfosporosinus sp. OT]EGW41381.1 3-oxoacyl-[acyl-carrier-(ACP)] synthase family protein [Desulfosporosinus sp. OT]
MYNVYINKIAVFLPNQSVGNDEIEDVLGLVNDKPSRAKGIILRSNGIKSRYYVVDKKTKAIVFNNAQITANAIRVLEDDNFKLADIECLVCGTSSPDQLMPNHALMTQGELGLGPVEAVATSGICLSGITALNYGYMTVLAGLKNNAVVTGSEVSSLLMMAKNFVKESEINELNVNGEIAFQRDFLRWMLSDGAGAVLIQNTPNHDKISLKIEWIDIISYAGEMPVCMYSGGKIEDDKFKGWRELDNIEKVMQESVLQISQDVKLLNQYVVYYTVEKPISEISKKRNLKEIEIDYFLPHYSSEFFRDKTYEALKRAGFEIPYHKWFTNLTYKGNTGAASIYIILEELFNSGKLKKGEKILCFVPESGRFSTSFMLFQVV